MFTVIEGLTGSGKTFLQTKLIHREWKTGADIWVNYPVKFNDNEGVTRWTSIWELYSLHGGIIAMDEIQELVGHWFSMPISFRSKIAQHRKHQLDFYATTQDFNNIHVQIRRNVHILYRCYSIFRFPRSDSKKPIFQVIRVIKKERRISNDYENIKFLKVGRASFYFLSKYWTKTLYNTYQDVNLQKFLCKIKLTRKENQKKARWVMKLYNRDLINQGKARL